ncbi:hypothetical protein [Streptomyces sp. NRRL F-5053]|uniref:hypothetical protein n=1 Tax=Streptomyces sp. NRRL F-5053 TaxID=1463854 RepID=UPI0004CA8ADA|nr:hypothetical protein [Streptomyces sp. NRRL F-5053]
MAVVKVTKDRLTVEFSGRESMWARMDSVTVPLAAVREVRCVDRPLREARGARKGYQSAFTKIGVWGVFTGPRQLVSARRGEPGLHIRLDKAAAGGGAGKCGEFDEIIVSVADPAGLAEQIAHGTGKAA